MKFGQALAIIQQLGKSQGFYSRMYQNLAMMDAPSKNKFEESIKDCKDELDLILYLEA